MTLEQFQATVRDVVQGNPKEVLQVPVRIRVNRSEYKVFGRFIFTNFKFLVLSTYPKFRYTVGDLLVDLSKYSRKRSYLNRKCFYVSSGTEFDVVSVYLHFDRKGKVGQFTVNVL